VLDVTIILKWMLGNRMEELWLDQSGLGYEQVAGFYLKKKA
jgi:hypothetical protein